MQKELNIESWAKAFAVIDIWKTEKVVYTCIATATHGLSHGSQILFKAVENLS